MSDGLKTAQLSVTTIAQRRKKKILKSADAYGLILATTKKDERLCQWKHKTASKLLDSSRDEFKNDLDCKAIPSENCLTQQDFTSQTALPSEHR